MTYYQTIRDTNYVAAQRSHKATSIYFGLNIYLAN